MAEILRGRRNVLQTMDDSELIRRYRLDRAGIVFVTDLIREKLTLAFFFLFYLLVFFKKKNLYCVRLTKTSHNTCMLLLFCWFLLLLLSSFVSRFG